MNCTPYGRYDAVNVVSPHRELPQPMSLKTYVTAPPPSTHSPLAGPAMMPPQCMTGASDESEEDEDACVRIADETGERRGIGAAPEGGEPMADTEWVGDDDMRNPRVGQRRVEGGYQGAIRVALNF